jgi:hypothetical protein
MSWHCGSLDSIGPSRHSGSAADLQSRPRYDLQDGGTPVVAWAQEKSLEREVAERLIGQIVPSWIPESFEISSDSKEMVWRVSAELDN